MLWDCAASSVDVWLGTLTRRSSLGFHTGANDNLDTVVHHFKPQTYSLGVWCSVLLMASLLRSALTLALLAATTSALPPSNPFCGTVTAFNGLVRSLELVLECAPGAGVISAIDFAAYGTPDTEAGCGAFTHAPACDAAGFLARVQSACLNESLCIVEARTSDGDPCPGTAKTIAVQARCSGSPGGAQVALQPSCAMAYGAPPCPLPAAPWARTWALNRSTICQPGNSAGWLDAQAAARFGLVSLDWSIASGVWRPQPGAPCSATTGAATLVEQCRRIKAVDPTTKCFVYRNSELSLEWLEPQRDAMEDPAKAGFFLQYQPGNPSNVTPGTVYNEDAGGKAVGCRQYFWNYSNPLAFAYALEVSEQGELGTGSPYVDGTYQDDSQAVPQEHPAAPVAMGLSPAQLLQAQNATWRFVDAAIGALASRGKFIWQGFNNAGQGDPDSVLPGPTRATCAAWMARACQPAWQAVPMTLQTDGTNATLAAFLVARGPVAYIGWGWGIPPPGPLPPWEALWDLDVGEPLGLCAETSQGVFERAWSKGRAALDCNTFEATLDFQF
jgi:hypothetical protein